MNIINDIFHNGSLWALVLTIIYIYNEVEPVLKSHLRNNHEKSLLASANRIVPSVAKVADASPSDRENEMISELFEFASKRHIPINIDLAKSFITKAKSDYINNGGKMPKTVNNLMNKAINEGDNK